jgi:hypothetical protein
LLYSYNVFIVAVSGQTSFSPKPISQKTMIRDPDTLHLNLAPLHLDARALPTPLAQVARRVNTVGLQASADSFLMVSYLVEASVKLLAIGLHAALRPSANEAAYRIGHELVRGDGLGTWEQAIRSATSLPAASFLPPEMNPVVTWVSQRRGRPEDTWYAEAGAAIRSVCDVLGVESGIPERKPNVLHLLNALVQVRNKTKAHGAVGPEFYQFASAPYMQATTAFLANCPLFQSHWYYLYRRGDQKKGVQLRGDTPIALRDAEAEQVDFVEPGVYIWPAGGSHPLSASTLIFADAECRDFYLPNGGYNSSKGTAEFVDYATGHTRHTQVPHFARQPAPLPTSETHGMDALEVHTNAFGNLPSVPRGYVERADLQAELELRLRDRNHPIITLHGRGGIGKTSLALWMAHRLTQEADPPFDAIIWFSARDVDLQASGPKPVRPAVISLVEVSRFHGQLMSSGQTVDDFALALQSSSAPRGRGNLFVFDNFETLAEVVELHRFLDTHTHIPNKVLITSRERAFKADFPIEVKGMSLAEATELLHKLSVDLSVGGMLNAGVIQNIYEYSEGHPYLLRILLGEMAKEGRYVPAKTLLPRRMDIVNAVFERSFNRLSEPGRRVFLVVTTWRSAISELALLVVLGRHGFDVEAGIEECVRLSLIVQMYFADNQRAFYAPQLARIFGTKKRDGDPDRLIIQEDLLILHRFGVVPAGQVVQVPEEQSINEFLSWAIERAPLLDAAAAGQLDSILETLAELWPKAWVGLARFRQGTGAPADDVEHALRRAVEENPTDKEVLLERAQYARDIGSEATWISSRVRAVELDPDDLQLLYAVASDLNAYLSRHSTEIPPTRRGVYLASVREHLARRATELDADGLSQIAWLYLNEGNFTQAAHYTRLGLDRQPSNAHCQKLAERLSATRQQG